MKRCSFAFLLLVAFAVMAWTGDAGRPSAKPLLQMKNFAALHEMIKPAEYEAYWSRVPWMPSSNVWAARQKAAEEDKPLFLWYMAGEPLGRC